MPHACGLVLLTDDRLASVEAALHCTHLHQGSANLFEDGRGGSEVKLHVSCGVTVGVLDWCAVVVWGRIGEGGPQLYRIGLASCVGHAHDAARGCAAVQHAYELFLRTKVASHQPMLLYIAHSLTRAPPTCSSMVEGGPEVKLHVSCGSPGWVIGLECGGGVGLYRIRWAWLVSHYLCITRGTRT